MLATIPQERCELWFCDDLSPLSKTGPLVVMFLEHRQGKTLGIMQSRDLGARFSTTQKGRPPRVNTTQAIRRFPMEFL